MNVPENADLAVHFAARLVGGSLVTPEFFASSGTAGAAISFIPAINVKRNVHITNDFMHDQPLMAEDAFNAIQLVGSKWTMLGSMADVMAFLGPAGPARDRRQREVLVFLSAVEVASEDCGRGLGIPGQALDFQRSRQTTFVVVRSVSRSGNVRPRNMMILSRNA